MPSIIPRQRVQGPSTTSASGGAALAQGLAQAGSALLGQVADQRFEAEELEIKQLEKRETMNAQSAVIDKNNERILAREDIRKNFEPTQYIDEMDKWEEQHNKEHFKEKSPFYVDSFSQKDFGRRLDSAGRMGTAMRSDLLSDTSDGFDTMLANAVTRDDVNDIEQWGLEDGVMTPKHVKEHSDDRRFELDRDELFILPVTEALAKLNGPDFEGRSVDVKKALHTAIMNQHKMDVEVENLNNGLADYVVTSTINKMIKGGAQYNEMQKYVDSIPKGLPQRTTAQNLVNKKFSASIDKLQLSAKELTDNSRNIMNFVRSDINMSKFTRKQKGFDPSDPEHIAELNRLNESLSAHAKDINKKVTTGELTRTDADNIIWHIDIELLSMGHTGEAGNTGWTKWSPDTNTIGKMGSEYVLNINTPGQTPMSIKDEGVFIRSVQRQINKFGDDRYVNKPVEELTPVMEEIIGKAWAAVDASHGVTSEKGQAERRTQRENTTIVSKSDDAIRKIASKGQVLDFEQAKRLAPDWDIPESQVNEFALDLVEATKGNAQ